MSEETNGNSFLNNFDGYVLIFCAIILSALKVVELILKKKQNNNFTHLNTFENDLKKLQNDFVELSRIQSGALSDNETTDLSPELSNDKSKIDNTKRFSKSASILKK